MATVNPRNGAFRLMDVTRHTRVEPRRSLPRVLSALALRHPLRVVIAAALLAILGFVLAATRPEFHTGRGEGLGNVKQRGR